MDCADRISVMTEERTIEPIRLMAEYRSLSEAAVRVAAAGRRWDVVVRRRTSSDGPDRYAWRALELDEAGERRPGGREIDGADGSDALVEDPEAAYWCAIEALADPDL